MTTRLAALLMLVLMIPAVPARADEAGPLNRTPPSPSRPAVLPALYASYAALQVYDVYSTRQALGRGAREANPLMQHVVGNQGAFWAVKASAMVGTIAAAERLWKNDKKAAAIGVMIASNAVAAIVANRNAGALRQRR